jgi:hypothetical protein
MEMNEHFLFLNVLRRTGEVNMFGAAPWLEDYFLLDKRTARKVLLDWMQWANAEPANLML